MELDARWLWVGALVLCRVAPVVLWTPLLAAPMAPWLVRAAAALACAGLLWPLIWPIAGLEAAPDALGALALVLKELVVGGALAFLVARIFWAAQGAGALMESGLRSPGADPGLLHGAASSWLPLLGAVTFVAAGGHLVLLAALARSFEVVPLAGPALEASDGPALGFALIQQGGGVFVLALALALPVLAARWLAELAVAASWRAAPWLGQLWGAAAPRLLWGVVALLACLHWLVQALVQATAEQLGGAPAWLQAWP